MTEATFDLWATIPWGDGPDELPARHEIQPSDSLIVPEQVRRALAPVAVRLNSTGGLLALDAPSADPGLVRVDAAGRVSGRLPFRHSEGSTLVDFAAAGEGQAITLTATGASRHLARLGADGSTLWETEVAPWGERILHDPRLLVAGDDGELTEFDRLSGRLQATHRIDGVAARSVLSATGTVFTPTYDPAENRRGLSLYDLDRGPAGGFVGEHDAYGFLLNLLGADAHDRVYCYKMPDEAGPGTLARFTAEGEIEARVGLQDVVCGALDGVVHTFTAADGRWEVHAYGDSTGSDRWVLEPAGPGGAGATLVRVAEPGRFEILTGEGPGTPGTLLTFHGRELVDSRIAASDLDGLGSLPPCTYWQVDPAGRVHLPIPSPEGLRLVRVQLGGD